MNKYVILVKGGGGICVAVDILSDGASHEISSLSEQGFYVVYETCWVQKLHNFSQYQ